MRFLAVKMWYVEYQKGHHDEIPGCQGVIFWSTKKVITMRFLAVNVWYFDYQKGHHDEISACQDIAFDYQKGQHDEVKAFKFGINWAPKGSSRWHSSLSRWDRVTTRKVITIRVPLKLLRSSCNLLKSIDIMNSFEMYCLLTPGFMGGRVGVSRECMRMAGSCRSLIRRMVVQTV